MGVQGFPTPLAVAERVGHAVLSRSGMPGMVCGSVRRRKAVVSDVDVLVVTSGQLDRSSWPDGFRVTAKRATAVYSEARVEVCACPPDAVAPMALFMTGSATFNMECRQRAIARGWKLNQYGIWRDGERIDEATDADPSDPLSVACGESYLMAMLGVEWAEPSHRLRTVTL